MDKICKSFILMICSFCSLSSFSMCFDKDKSPYVVSEHIINEEEFNRMKQKSEEFNLKNTIIRLDSVEFANVLSDSAIVSSAVAAQSFITELKTENGFLWSEDEYWHIFNYKYENGDGFLVFSSPDDKCAYWVIDSINYRIEPSTIHLEQESYNKNGLLVGVVGVEDISTTTLIVYKKESGKFVKIACYDRDDSSVSELFWIGDDTIYVKALKYIDGGESFVPLYYKLVCVSVTTTMAR